MKKSLLLGICGIVGALILSLGCGSSGGGFAAPDLATIRAAISLNNQYGIVPGLVLGEITMPACSEDASANITYSMSNLPTWLTFDATTRALALSEGTTVPADALTSYEVTYTCTEGGAANLSAPPTTTSKATSSSSFPINDLDGGGVVDGYEYQFGEVPLVNPNGWFWLTPESVGIYRGGSGAPSISTGIMITSVGMNPTDAADDVSDFDGDTIANNDEISDGTNIFVATSSGQYGAATTYATGNGPGGVDAGDVNGDGNLDLVVANRGNATTSTVSVSLGNGDGTFGTATYYDGDRPVDVGLADLDGDGDLDIVSSNFSSAAISVYLNNGDGTFAAKVNYTKAEANGMLALGDLNGDGYVDIVAANGVYSPSTTLSVLLGNGDGTFAAAVSYTSGDVPRDVTLADLDGDGDLDIAVTNSVDGTISILLGNGDGTFAAKTDYTAGASVSGIAAGDVDGDGNIDLLTTGGGGNVVSIFINNGDGTFAAKVDYAVSDAPGRPSLFDADGDGDLDMAVAIDGGGAGTVVSVRFNAGDGTFGAATEYTVGTRPTDLTAADFDGDGDLDLAVTHFSPNDPAIILNQ